MKLDVQTLDAKKAGSVATTLLELIREGELALPDDGAVVDELHNPVEGIVPWRFRMDHDRGRHDDRAVALALAATALLEAPHAEPARWASAVVQRRGTSLSSPPTRRGIRRTPAAPASHLRGTDGFYASGATDPASLLAAYSPAAIDALHRRLKGGRR